MTQWHACLNLVPHKETRACCALQFTAVTFHCRQTGLRITNLWVGLLCAQPWTDRVNVPIGPISLGRQDCTACYSMNVTVDNVRFRVVDRGSGQVILLLHGFPDSAKLWKDQVYMQGMTRPGAFR